VAGISILFDRLYTTFPMSVTIQKPNFASKNDEVRRFAVVIGPKAAVLVPVRLLLA
jgi:hypothetical protein